MLNDEQKKFLMGQIKTESGQEWIKVLKTLVDSLYSSRGVDIKDIEPRKIAAEIIEKEIIKTAEVGDQEINKQKNNEYV